MSKRPSRSARFARRPRLGAWLAALAVVLQALLPIWHQQAMAMTAPGAADDGQTVVICTPYGYQVMPLADLIAGQAGEARAPEGKAPSVPRECALMCQALGQQMAAGAPMGVFVSVPVAVTLSPWVVVGGTILPAGPCLNARPRGPPGLTA